jgi:phosphoribosylanthranilate isomerase
VERVGVVRRVDTWDLAELASAAGLTTLQLSWVNGAKIALPEFQAKVQMIREELPPKISMINRVVWTVNPNAAEEKEEQYEVRKQMREIYELVFQEYTPDDRIVMDARVGLGSGGLGVPFDWDRARAVMDIVPSMRQRDLRFIVAGGLNPDNVESAIRDLDPYGVDVTTGVEQSPGLKDHGRIREFIHNAKRVPEFGPSSWGSPQSFQRVLWQDSSSGAYDISPMMWEHVPFRAQKGRDGVERVTTDPFRAVPRQQRCIVSAETLATWLKNVVGMKEPFSLEMADGSPYGFGAVYETWEKNCFPWMRRFTILTTEANEVVRPFHDRMPVIIPVDEYGRWLGATDAEAYSLLRPFPAEKMRAWK